MPSIADLIAKNSARIAAGGNLVDIPEMQQPAPTLPQNSPPAPITGSSLPIRGTFTPAQMQPADYTNTSRVFLQGSQRSGAFPNPPVSAPVVVQSPASVTSTIPVTQQPVSTNLSNALTSVTQVGTVDSTIGIVSQRGSMVPSASQPWEYSSTTSQILLLNVGQVILRADGSLLKILDATTTITGLKANTPYYFYPYWSEYEQAVNFVSSSGNISNLVGATFNGSTGDVTTTTNVTISNGTAYTLEVWFRTTASAIGMIVEANKNQTGAPDTTNRALGIGVNASGEVFGGPKAGSSTGWNNEAYNDGAWHQVVLTFDGTGAAGNYSGYIDGALIFTIVTSGYGSLGSAYWRIGNGGFTGSSTFFNGTIGPVAIWSGTAITAAQVAFHYNTMINSGAAAYYNDIIDDAPTYFWELNETSGTSAADSADSNTGTYSGGFVLNQSQATLIPFGSPAIAWEVPASVLAQAQAAQQNTPLTVGALVASTVASGSGGGVVSGQAVPACFSGNTLVKTQRGNVAIQDIKIGDIVTTARQTQRHVTALHNHPFSGDISDMGGGEFVTKSHRILFNGNWVAAKDLFNGWLSVESSVVFNISVDHDLLDDKDAANSEQSYTLANGLVVSNVKNFK